MGVRDYRELHAWRLADEARQRVWALTQRPPFAGHHWLRSQLQRAANSACSNIAEGFSRYRPADFARFLNMSKGSLSELIEHLSDVVAAGLATEDEVSEIRSQIKRSRGATTKLILYLKSTPPSGPTDSNP